MRKKVKIYYRRAHTKVFPCIASYAGDLSKRILAYLYCTKCNEIKGYHLNVQKHTSYKNGTNCINILYTGS